MSKLPVLSGKKLVKVLSKNGYRVVRQKGSHVFMENMVRKVTTLIPVHANEDLSKGLIRGILNELDISVDELIRMIKG